MQTARKSLLKPAESVRIFSESVFDELRLDISERTNEMVSYEENFARLKRVADRMGLVFNPNEARVQKVVGKMTDFQNAMGEYVCPCKQVHKPPLRGQEVLCPCPELADEIRRDGHCHCRLFYSPNQPSDESDESILGRRRTLDEYPLV